MSAKYNTYILELIRSNEIPHNKEANKSDEEKKSCTQFMMFDYFDILYYKELSGEEKRYTYYFSVEDSINNDEQRKVSQKTLSLYRHAGNDLDNGATSNPFAMEQPAEKACLSDKPFLGVIQICLCKETFINDILLGGEVNGFLCAIEQKVLNIAENALGNERNCETIKQIYRSSTTGDFCLAIRTDSISDIYRVASRLNDSRENGKDKESPKMMTYTNVGVECGVQNGKYCTFGKSFLQKHGGNTIALRLTADSNMLSELAKHTGNLELMKGLFGRYDYLLHISVEEFAKIYPSLCIKKFGALGSVGDVPGTEGFEKLILHPQIRYINERVLVDCSEARERTEDSEKRSEDVKGIEDSMEELKGLENRNNDLLTEIERIDEYREEFKEENRAFRDLYRSTLELYKAFSSIFMEKDAVINWLIWQNDMKVMCDCILSEMEEYDSIQNEKKKRDFRINLLGSWRESVQAINRYTRLVQNVNYQTYQSPVYEIQTQIDAEKMMVAYREAMRVYVQGLVKHSRDAGDPIGEIEPIIYPELRQSKVQVVELFANMGWGKTPDTRAIICMVPSFEYFGRMYDLLPWIMHEASHYFRVMSRDRRNSFVVEYVVMHVFLFVTQNIVREYSRQNSFLEEGRVVQNLRDAFQEIWVREIENDLNIIKEQRGKEPSFEQMADMTTRHLKSFFALDMDGKKELGTVRKALFDVLYEEMRKRSMLDTALINDLKEVRTGEKDLPRIERLIKLLVEHDRNEIAARFPEQGDIELTAQDIFCVLPDWLEERSCHICKNLPSESAPYVREYTFMIKRLHRLYECYKNASEECGKQEGKKKEILEKVYDAFDKRIKEDKAPDMKNGATVREYLYDAEEMYFLNQIGILNGDKQLFCDQIMKLFQKIDRNQIDRRKWFRTSVYRESCADLIMAASLQMTGFGYCRQVLQTVSDTVIDRWENEYDIINYTRFRTVAAVLLTECEGVEVVRYTEGKLKIDGSGLIEQGKRYCTDMLRCIREAIQHDMSNHKEIDKKAENEDFEKLNDFLGDINAQLDYFFSHMSWKQYKTTLLFVFLHGKADETDAAVTKKWENYKEVVGRYIKNKHHFWRLECFCWGMYNILPEGFIVVEKDLFEHMQEIYQLSADKDGKGCKWEQEIWESMRDAKKEVGDFYNDPKTIYDKSPEQKLESTIDFIQDFYYHNRAYIARKREEGTQGGKAEAGTCEVCGESGRNLSTD